MQFLWINMTKILEHNIFKNNIQSEKLSARSFPNSSTFSETTSETSKTLKNVPQPTCLCRASWIDSECQRGVRRFSRGRRRPETPLRVRNPAARSRNSAIFRNFVKFVPIFRNSYERFSNFRELFEFSNLQSDIVIRRPGTPVDRRLELQHVVLGAV